MSAGAFTITNYETDSGVIAPIRVQPETLLATFNSTINAAVAGSPAPNFPSAQVSKSRRSLGLHARTVNVRITTGLPTGYLANQIHRIPCVNQAAYDAASKGSPAGYLGGTGVVVSKSPEKIN